MNYKDFINKTGDLFKKMSKDELLSYLYEIARKTPEKERTSFLQQLQEYCNKDNQKENNKSVMNKKMISDEKVKAKLASIREHFEKIQSGEMSILSQGYEDFSNGYWASKWIYEYEDNEGIGRIVEDAVMFAHDCMNDCRYQEAVSVFELVMNTQIAVEDEFSGEVSEFSLEEMVNERLAGVNLKIFALDVLYSNYQFQPTDRRPSVLFSYFSYPYFRDISIEDILAVGSEELKETDAFFQSWIDFLMQQNGDIAARLLKEALLHYKGTEGLLQMAREVYTEHPSIYLAALVEYEKAHNYKKMKEIGKEALKKLNKNLKIRSEIAIKAAQAAYSTGDKVFMRKCWYEAFYSHSTVANYLRLFVDKEELNKYKSLAEKRIKDLEINDKCYSQAISEISTNTVDSTEYKLLCFFSGHLDKIKGWCMEQKKPLGWSSSFIGCGVDLMLLYFYNTKYLGKATNAIANRVSNMIDFKEDKNMLFFRENAIFAGDAGIQNNENLFWNAFYLWRINYPIATEASNVYIGWLESVIDRRIDAIVSGQFRSKYEDVALLAAALGEVEESMGLKMARRATIIRYLNKYPRHSSFRAALEQYL